MLEFLFISEEINIFDDQDIKPPDPVVYDKEKNKRMLNNEIERRKIIFN